MALNAAPGYRSAELNLGITLSHLDQTERALACFEVLLEREPNDLEALLNAGLAQHVLGDLAAGRQRYQQVLAADPDPRPTRWAKTGRQFAVMDAEGRVAAHTGETASDWAGHVTGQYFTAQGNILAGEGVVKAMGAAFGRTEGHLSLRLLAALEAGQQAGGDRRGMQSAAMLIVKKDGGVWLNNDVVLRLQVDDHEQPIAELRRLVEMSARRFRRR